MFFKRTIAGIAALTTVAAASGITAFAADTTETAKDAGFKEAALNTLLYAPDKEGTMDCRYYDALPSIPYVKLTDFYKNWVDQDLEIKNNNDGTFEIKVPVGVTGILDVNKDTLSTDDTTYFFAPEDEATAESPLSDIYIKDNSDPHEAYPFAIDFGKYNIDIIADNDDIWFPAPTLCDVFTSDLKCPYYMDHTLVFGGELMTPFSITEQPMTPEHVSAMIEDNKDGRAADLIEYNYNELCLSFDLTYGYPGRPKFTELLKEKGLDGMLSEGNDSTRKIKELLHSTDFTEYNLGLDLLNSYLWDGGHTQFVSVPLYLDMDFMMNASDVRANMNLELEDAIDLYSDQMDSNFSYYGVKAAREAMIADADFVQTFDGTDYINGAIYFEKGDTAVFSFDGFSSDLDAWDKYYHEDGELPDEVITYFYNCILRADTNHEINNFVIDMGTNSGGLSTVLAHMFGLIADVSSIPIRFNTLDIDLDEKYFVDKNFDKVIDDYDKNFKTDLRFGVITSNFSFSCANLFPSMAHDNGIMIVGEQSGGGSCAIQIRMTADGNLYVLSSGLCLVDKDRNSIDGGIKPDFETVTTNEKLINEILTGEGPTTVEEVEEYLAKLSQCKDFTKTYNFEELSKYFDEFYGKAANAAETTTTAKVTDTTVSTTATTSVASASSTAANSTDSSESTTTSATTVKTEDTSSTTTSAAVQGEKKYFAPLSKMGDFVKGDYKSRTGKEAAESVLKENYDGTFTVILSDDKGNVLDKYIIDPETGMGRNSKGEKVDLPQTGNNSVKTVAAAAVAVSFMTVGAAAVYASGIGRKKKDNE